MQTTKKKPSLIFILVGAVLSGYLGYLINGAWTEGIAFNDFMNRFNEVCAVPFANYYNSNTVNAVAIALCIYAMAIIMYYTSQRNYMPGKEYGTARFENPKQVNKILADKDENFNRILSQNVKMSLDFRRLKLNGNILICGGSGAGKTFYESDVMPSRADGGNGGRTRTDAVVQHHISLVGIGAYQVLYQGYRLLRRMIECTGLVFLGYGNDRGRVFVVGNTHRNQFHFTVTAVRETVHLAPSMISPLRKARCHLGMIHRLPVIKHDNVLMLAQGHPVGIQVTRYPVFLPHEVIPPHPGLREHEPRREDALRKEDNGASRLGDPAVLFPQRFERYLPVPVYRLVATVQHAVRQIRYHGIDTAVRHELHALDTVHIIYVVNLYHGFRFYCFSRPFTR